MLAEYDFSQGVRGRHRNRKVGLDLPGVQFLTDDRGQKTAVLLDLQIHAQLWQQISDRYPNATGFQFLVDPQNHSTAVFLDFKEHLSIWQAVYDRLGITSAQLIEFCHALFKFGKPVRFCWRKCFTPTSNPTPTRSFQAA